MQPHSYFLGKFKHLSTSLFYKYGIKFPITNSCRDYPALRFLSTSQVGQHLRQEKLSWSYMLGTSSVPLRGLTVGQLLQKAADSYGDRTSTVVVHQNIRKSFRQVFEEADQVAAAFLSLDLKRGDRIGIWGPNSYEWILTQWAAARAGLVLVNVNPAYRVHELRYALNLVEVKALVMAETFRNQSLVDILKELIPPQQEDSSGIIFSPTLPNLKRLIIMSNTAHIPNAMRWSDLLERATPSLLSQVHNMQQRIQFDEPVNIQFTSGTTGNPKGATLTHHNIVNNSYLIGLRMDYHKKVHSICVPVPLYHCFGCVVAVVNAALHGASCVFPSPVFSAKETIKAVSAEKCTSLYGTPTMFMDLLNLPNLKDYDLSSLSTGILAGAPVPQTVAEAVAEHLNIKNCASMYGMTECGPITFQTKTTDSLEVRCSTVGQPSDHVEAKIVDLAGEVVPINTPGEIWTRGYNTMLGYWNQIDKTNEVITKDRWIRSGDIGVMDENGYCRIVGRIKDMIIRGGENIYPREIEELLHTHPDVQEAQAIGVPDNRLGEEICVWIRRKAGSKVSQEELKSFCQDKIAYYKVPRYWFFKESFPMTVTGKVQKFAMREISIKELGF